jgi:hypothetical protein
MNIKKIKMRNPPFRHKLRDKNLIQMVHPVSNQPLTENDTIQLKELENVEIIIIETKPHANYSSKKKEMFRPQKFYYRVLPKGESHA